MDRRVRRTREAIRKAYFDLLKEKGEERISVTEIARRADIDRKTFYLHFESADDIIKDFGEEKIHEIMEQLKDNGFFDHPLRLDLLFSSIQENLQKYMSIFKLIGNNPNYDFFWREIEDITEQAVTEAYKDKVKVSVEELKFYARFYIIGLISIYKEWLNVDTAPNLDAVTQYVMNMAQKGIMYIFD